MPIHKLIFLEPISCISSTQDNMCTLVSCTDSTLKLMDRQKGELLNEYKILFIILLGYQKIITKYFYIYLQHLLQVYRPYSW